MSEVKKPAGEDTKIRLPELETGAGSYNKDGGKGVGLESLNNFREIVNAGMLATASFYVPKEDSAGGISLTLGFEPRPPFSPFSDKRLAAMKEIDEGRIRVTYLDYASTVFLDPDPQHGGEKLFYHNTGTAKKPAWYWDVISGEVTVNDEGVTYPTKPGYDGPVIEAVTYRLDGEKINRTVPQEGKPKRLDTLDETRLGESVFKAVKDYLSDPKHKEAKDAGYFDVKIGAAHTLLRQVSDLTEPVTVNIAEVLESPVKTPALMIAIACYGWLKKATAINLETGEVIFATRAEARDALKAVFQIDERSYVDANSMSLSFYVHGQHTAKDTQDDAYLSAAWAWGAWEELSGEKVRGLSEPVKWEELRMPNGKKLPVAKLDDELARMERANISPKAFLYFALVKDDKGQTRFKPVTAPEKLEGAEKQVYMPVTDAETLLKLPFAAEKAPGEKEIQAYINTYGLNSLNHNDLVMNRNTIYGIVPDENYLFRTKTRDGADVFVIRVPTCNRDPITAQLLQGQQQEMAELGFLTVDEAAKVSAMISNLDPTGSSLVMSRSGGARTNMLDPLTGREEITFEYRLAILPDTIPPFVPDLIRQLDASGYPLDIPEDADDAEVLAAAVKFFVDSFFDVNGKEEFKWFLPGEAGLTLLTNEYFDFDDPRTWADPEGKEEPVPDPSGKMEPVLGADGKPVTGPDGKPLMQRAVMKDKEGNPVMRPMTVNLGGIPIPRKRAAFLVAIFLAYTQKAEDLGLTPAEFRKWQKALQYWSLGLSLGVTIAVSIGTVVYMVRSQRNLTSGSGDMDLNNVKNDGALVNISKQVAAKGNDTGIVGREVEAKSVLGKMAVVGEKNSVLLTGDPGIGKTTFIKYLAEVINTRDVSRGYLPVFEDALILEFKPASLIAGTAFRGQFENKLEKMLADVAGMKEGDRQNHWFYRKYKALYDTLSPLVDKKGKFTKRPAPGENPEFDQAIGVMADQTAMEYAKNLMDIARKAKAEGRKVILFIDEIHATMNIGATAESGSNIWQFLKPAMADGTITIIGATTAQEKWMFLGTRPPPGVPPRQTDPALANRFTEEELSEPIHDAIIKITRNVTADQVTKQTSRDPFFDGLQWEADADFYETIYERGPDYSIIGGRPRSTNVLAAQYVVDSLQKWSEKSAAIQRHYRPLYDAATAGKKKEILVAYYRELEQKGLRTLRYTKADLETYLKTRPFPVLLNTQNDVRIVVEGAVRDFKLPIRLDLSKFCLPSGLPIDEEIRRYQRIELVIDGTVEYLYRNNATLNQGARLTLCNIASDILARGQVTSEDIANINAQWSGFKEVPGVVELEVLLKTGAVPVIEPPRDPMDDLEMEPEARVELAARYDATLRGISSALEYNTALLESASLSEAQRTAYKLEYDRLFGPKGTHAALVAQVTALEADIARLEAARVELIRPILPQLQGIPPEQREETASRLLGEEKTREFQLTVWEVETKQQALSAHKNTHAEVLKRYGLLLYQSGQRTGSPADISQLRLLLATLGAQRDAYQQELARLRAPTAPTPPPGSPTSPRGKVIPFPSAARPAPDADAPTLDPASPLDRPVGAPLAPPVAPETTDAAEDDGDEITEEVPRLSAPPLPNPAAVTPPADPKNQVQDPKATHPDAPNSKGKPRPGS